MEIVMFTVDIIAPCAIGDLSTDDVIQATLLPRRKNRIFLSVYLYEAECVDLFAVKLVYGRRWLGEAIHSIPTCNCIKPVETLTLKCYVTRV